MSILRKGLVLGAMAALLTLGQSAAKADLYLYVYDTGTGTLFTDSTTGSTLVEAGKTVGNFHIGSIVAQITGVPGGYQLDQSANIVTQHSGSPDVLLVEASATNLIMGSTRLVSNTGSVTFGTKSGGDLYETQAWGSNTNTVLGSDGFVSQFQQFISSPGNLSYGGTTNDVWTGGASPFSLSNGVAIGLLSGHRAVGASASTTITATPEPTSLALAALGLPLLLVARRLRRKAA